MKPVYVCVIGKSDKPGDPTPPHTLAAAETVGREVARRGGILVSGGRDGVMEAASRGAKLAGGLTVGILPGLERSEANPYVDVAIPTGLGWMRNWLTVRAGDVVIVIHGGIGTLNEVTCAYETKPIVVLEGSGGWADRLRQAAYEGQYLDPWRRIPLHFAQTAEEAVALAFQLADKS